MSLLGTKVLVLGGNGYLGNYFAARFVQHQATVLALSRSGPRHTYPENQAIQWINGDIMQPETLRHQINSADIIVHAIGTLFDTSLTKNTPPGGQGTYEQMNRDTLASLLKVLDKPKTIIYISSAGHPPFLGRYLKAKHQAEDMLNNSQHRGYCLRPGFIYSWKYRWWSIPVKWMINIWRVVYPLLQKVVPERGRAHRLLREFRQGENVGLRELANGVLELSVNGSSIKINEVKHINELSNNFINQHSQ